jgi:mannose-6-phosphate isomerase-like protein (cupin superfamily)
VSSAIDPQYHKSGALYVPTAEGTTKWGSGDIYTIKATANDTNGSLGFLVATVPPGNGPVAHVHTRNEEAFFLLDGELEFLDGDKTFIASAGDLVVVPRGIRHRFKNVSTQPAKMALLYTPGGQERFFLDHCDDPLPGHQPELWPVDRFTPEMRATLDEMGTVFVPE